MIPEKLLNFSEQFTTLDLSQKAEKGMRVRSIVKLIEKAGPAGRRLQRPRRVRQPLARAPACLVSQRLIKYV